eukprot:COSAG05_NODE_239_length_13139_cov_14.870475_9_plen_65_part_00
MRVKRLLDVADLFTNPGQCLIRSTEIALITHFSFTEFFTAIRFISKSERIPVSLKRGPIYLRIA